MTKPIKYVCAQRRLRSAWASAQSDQSSLSAWRNLRPLATYWAQSKDSNQSGHPQRKLWSDWADGQADLSLRWAHTRFVGFVMSRLISLHRQSRDISCRYARKEKLMQVFRHFSLMRGYAEILRTRLRFPCQCVKIITYSWCFRLAHKLCFPGKNAMKVLVLRKISARNPYE